MKLKLFSIIFFFVFLSCTIKYPIITESQLRVKTRNKQLSYDRYVVMQDVIEDVKSDKNDIITKTLFYIKNKQSKKAEDLIKTLPDSLSSEIVFCEGLLMFYQNDFSSAYNKFTQTKIEHYRYLIYLLTADSMIEINKKSLTPRFHKNEILHQYQKAYNSCDKENTKNVIKMHEIHFKYKG